MLSGRNTGSEHFDIVSSHNLTIKLLTDTIGRALIDTGKHMVNSKPLPKPKSAIPIVSAISQKG